MNENQALRHLIGEAQKRPAPKAKEVLDLATRIIVNEPRYSPLTAIMEAQRRISDRDTLAEEWDRIQAAEAGEQ